MFSTPCPSFLGAKNCTALPELTEDSLARNVETRFVAAEEGKDDGGERLHAQNA
jgi:hypothetical protein